MRKVIFFLSIFVLFLPFAVNAKTQFLYNEISDHAILDNQKSEYVNSNEGIDYSQVSSDTNGKGIYIFSDTKDDEYPIYYYRGNVDNNNIIVKDICWKIVRTTSTGGIKLIYNGQYTTTGCDPNVGIGNTFFNSNINKSLSNLSYMYGDIYEGKAQGLYWYSFDKDRPPISKTLPSTGNYLASSTVEYEDGIYRLINPIEATANSFVGKYSCFSTTNTTCSTVKYITQKGKSGSKPYVVYIPLDHGDTFSSLFNQFYENKNVKFGKTFIYQDGKYTVTDDINFDISNWGNKYSNFGNYRYTCMNPSGECEKIKYIVFGQSGSFYYIELENGDSFQDAVTKMSTPTNDSIIKENIDQWFETNLNDIIHLFEDTPWCNDKQIPTEQSIYYSDYIDNGYDINDLRNGIFFENYMRYLYIKRPSFMCDPLDSYTVNSDLGNKALKYPVGLLTFDEIVLAGYQKNQASNAYLNSNENWYLLSPFLYRASSFDDIGAIYRNGVNLANLMCYDCAIRPSISLKNDVILLSGDGTEENPYRIDESKLYKISVEIVDETEELNIEINDLTQVRSEEEVIFKVTPVKGYKVNRIRILDENQNEINFSETGNQNEYSFIMPSGDVTIIPSYERVSNEVNVEDNVNTKQIVIEVENAKAVVYEDVVRFVVTPEEGYEVEDIVITDSEGNIVEYQKTNKENEYEFTMPFSDVTITPKYRLIEVVKPNNLVNPSTGQMFFPILFLLMILGILIYSHKEKKNLVNV